MGLTPAATTIAPVGMGRRTLTTTATAMEVTTMRTPMGPPTTPTLQLEAAYTHLLLLLLLKGEAKGNGK